MRRKIYRQNTLKLSFRGPFPITKAPDKKATSSILLIIRENHRKLPKLQISNIVNAHLRHNIMKPTFLSLIFAIKTNYTNLKKPIRDKLFYGKRQSHCKRGHSLLSVKNYCFKFTISDIFRAVYLVHFFLTYKALGASRPTFNKRPSQFEPSTCVRRLSEIFSFSFVFRFQEFAGINSMKVSALKIVTSRR